ncbi:HemX protein, negative effector of steady-state concentration of glutamyl-tRNA reductase [Enhygromyxa salina]|uniref:HemX protein, negative effector of steady-state concentration of glutamyl-tRNA reductase n=1 Tax=Enhygromyxa salina TaxID=215803 RepID=A0A0C1ZM17_9BACT|nr:cytochrome c biogenesis protein CcsA [Enhygromyxa salina]KIG11918.1 HemX protein, negative effector of steady-state concentration of glutamyl-tRNA reductase [Enhygromyxa salina]
MLPFFILAALAYGAASFAYGAGTGEDSPVKQWARALLAGAALLHTATVGAQCVEGNHPFKSVFLATSLGLLIAVVGFLAISAKRRPMRALGAVLAPFGLIALTLGVVMGPATGVGAGSLSAGVVRAHIALATVGVSGFTLAAGVAGLYLGMERRLRTKQFQKTETGISLRGLDRLHWWLVLLVTPVFTLAIVTGAVALLREGGPAMLSGRLIELVAAGVAFVATSAALISRAVWGLRGRKAAWLTMVAFLCMVLILVSYALRS